MKEKTISLADLAIHILLRWRSIVVMLFLGGIFLGVFSFVRSSQNAAPQTQDESEALKDNMDLKEAIQRFLADEDIDLEAVVKEHPNADIEQYIKMLKAGLEDKLAEALQNNIEYLLYYEDLYRGREDYGKESILMRIDPDKACRLRLPSLSHQRIWKAHIILKGYMRISPSVRNCWKRWRYRLKQIPFISTRSIHYQEGLGKKWRGAIPSG